MFFLLYAATTATGSVTGDNPEFVVVADELGVHHAPGYPLAAMGGFLFGLLPFSATYAINLSAAACGAVTVVLIYLTGRRLDVPVWFAAAAAALYGVNPLVWEFFIQIEAFPFLAVLVALTTLLLVMWKQQPTKLRLLLLAALTFGLGMAAHQNMMLLVPAILALVWSERQHVLGHGAVIAGALGLAFAGWLLPYTYELWASARDPYLNWGDISGVGDLVTQLRRANYTDVSFGLSGLSSSPERLGWLVVSFGFSALLLAFGLVQAWKTRNWYARYVLTGFGAFVVAMLLLSGEIANYGYFVISRFFLMWHVVAAPVFGLGLVAAQHWVVRRWSNLRWSAIAVPVAVAAVIAMLAALTLPQVNQRGRELTNNYASDVLNTVDEGGVLMVSGDPLVLPVVAAQQVREERPDVRVIITPLLAADWYVDQLARRYPDMTFTDGIYGAKGEPVLTLFQDNPDLAFFQSGGVDIEGPDRSLEGNYYFARQGLVFRVLPFAENVDVGELASDLEARYLDYRVPDVDDVRSELTSFEPQIMSAYVSPLIEMGDIYKQADQLDLARQWYQKAVDMDPTFQPALDALVNLNA